MNITCFCPQCDNLIRNEIEPENATLSCPNCQWSGEPRPGSIDEAGVHECAVCPSEELYLRKDFSQNLGLTIIGAGFLVSCIPWYYGMPLATYAILFATAAFDAVLWYVTGNLLECYRCRAQYRKAPGLEAHSPFNLEVYEKYRQQEARLAQEEREAQIAAWKASQSKSP